MIELNIPDPGPSHSYVHYDYISTDVKVEYDNGTFAVSVKKYRNGKFDRSRSVSTTNFFEMLALVYGANDQKGMNHLNAKSATRKTIEHFSSLIPDIGEDESTPYMGYSLSTMRLWQK